MADLWKDRRAWLLLLALGAVIGLMDASQSYLLFHRSPWTRTLLLNLTYWLTFAAMVPGVLFLADRVRLDGPFRLSRVIVHLIGAFCFVIVHFAFAALVSEPFQTRFFVLLRNYSAGNFLQYWAIVVIYYAIHYYHEARQREVEAAQLQMSLTEARLSALRSQLNPHFLFNTLNTISVLALKGDERAVVETLSQLSDLLRASLDDDRPQEIPLSEELQFLGGYLEIQRMRFADRLSVHYEIASETIDALVPSMVLQPLVENAVRHGVSEQCGMASIVVRSAREGDGLQLQVRDQGPGFRDGPQRPRAKGIGLGNTEARLRQLYGGAQRIDYGTSNGAGGIVTITIPFHTRDGAPPIDRREPDVAREETASIVVRPPGDHRFAAPLLEPINRSR